MASRCVNWEFKSVKELIREDEETAEGGRWDRVGEGEGLLEDKGGGEEASELGVREERDDGERRVDEEERNVRKEASWAGNK